MHGCVHKSVSLPCITLLRPCHQSSHYCAFRISTQEENANLHVLDEHLMQEKDTGEQKERKTRIGISK